MSPNYTAFALLVRSVLSLLPAHGGRSLRTDALVQEAQLRQLQRIEERLAEALMQCGTPAEQAAQSSLSFVSQCARQYSSRTATSS